MLKQSPVIRKGISGIKQTNEKIQEMNWLKRHPKKTGHIPYDFLFKPINMPLTEPVNSKVA